MSAGTSPENVNSEQLIEIIRQKVQQRKSATSTPPVHELPSQRGSDACYEALGEITSITRAISQEVVNLGEPTPTPPTIRGRFGRLIMRAIGSALWWYSYQLKVVGGAMQQLFQEQVKTFGAVLQQGADSKADILELRQELRNTVNRIQQLESAQIQGVQAVQRQSRVFEDDYKRLETMLASRQASFRSEQASFRSEYDKAIQQLADSIRDAEKRLCGMTAALAQSETRLFATEAQKQEFDTFRARTEAEIQTLSATLSPQIANLATRISDLGLYTHHTRAQLTLLDRRLSLLIEEARKPLPTSEAEGYLPKSVATQAHRHDGLYLAFQDVFRGTREEIKRRQSVYVPMLQQHNIGSKSMSILDLGCGRGEWLEVLRDNGMQGRGLDRNEAMLKVCRDLGLDVLDCELLPYLRTLPDASLGAVTAFHLIEHLPFESVIDLIDEAVRTIRSGGILILETPNPQNVLVGSQNFYYDPTHIKPLPSGLIYFFVEARGFCNVEIKELHPFPEVVRVPEDGQALPARFNTYFYGPQDYAVIGHKP